MEKAFGFYFPCLTFIPGKKWCVAGQVLTWNLRYLDLPVATGAGSHIISHSFYKLFPLPVCLLKLFVDFWASLSANANPSELHTVPDRSFPVLGW